MLFHDHHRFQHNHSGRILVEITSNLLLLPCTTQRIHASNLSINTKLIEEIFNDAHILLTFNQI